MTMAIEVVVGATTHPGRVRSHNEDAYLAAAPIFLVADGMGGQARGEAASAAVVDQFEALVGRPSVALEDLEEVATRVGASVSALADDDGAPGSTVSGVALTVSDDVPCWLVFNVGDSRTYLLSDGVLDQITVDHSRVQEMVSAGLINREEARIHRDRNIITLAFGAGLNYVPSFDIWLLPAIEGDKILVCSDGISSELTDALIAATMMQPLEPQVIADHLVAAALDAGGRDNVTAVVVAAAGAAGPMGGIVTEGDTWPGGIDIGVQQ